jgi:hypothetical protein
MNFKKDYDGEAKAIITDAFVFTDFKPGELPDMKFFTHVAAWDTGAEHTSLSKGKMRKKTERPLFNLVFRNRQIEDLSIPAKRGGGVSQRSYLYNI